MTHSQPSGGPTSLTDVLARALAVLCDDLLFATLASESLDDGCFRELCKRRAALHEELLRGSAPLDPFTSDLTSWLVPLVRDAASICAPAWMPMNELVASGLTLSGGARGVRSLFSSKPSDKEEQRVRRLGNLAVRVLLAALSSDAPLTGDEQRLGRALVASLGLPPEEEAPLVGLVGLGHVDAASIEVLGELDAKATRQLMQGAWQGVLQDGLDAREEGALAVLASRLGMKVEDMAALGASARQETEARRVFGRAAVDSLYWVLGDEPALARAVSALVTSISTPQPDRGAVLSALAHGAPPVEVNRASLGRSARGAVLAISWTAALRTNPTFARKAELAARLDRVAEVVGGDGPRVRDAVEGLLGEQLTRLAAIASRG
jgi:hypothetical protein